MRENRLYGSEGGASNDRPYPYSIAASHFHASQGAPRARERLFRK